MAFAACGRQSSPAASRVLPPTSGTLPVEGLTAPVRVVRDRWGVPHIYATNQRDLFFAQGFVQAQDRLFQMDLWRRSVQGRLAEVLGANFIERDAMTRRVQYHGDMPVEWASYGPDAKAIADDFVSGINAWVAVARANLPEEFVLAGWSPERWTADDLVNRTDAFLASANASAEVFRAQLVAAVGARRADALVAPLSGIQTDVPRGLDVGSVSYVVADALRRVGTPPVFSGFAAPLGIGSNAWVVSGTRSVTGAPLLAADPHRPLAHPSLRYLVHLNAPGWNVIGATAPWLPGVVIGHNDRVAWGMTSLAADVQDVYVEEVNAANPRQVRGLSGWVDMQVVGDPITVKGRSVPFAFEREHTPHGVLIASDRERHRAFTLRSTGFEAGTAAELGALAIDRAQSESQLREALAYWKAPATTVVYADADGRTGSFRAALVPVRRSWSGELPVPGWTGAYEWQGWRILSDERDRSGARDGAVVSANDSVARTNRLGDVFRQQPTFSVDDFKRLQHDTLAWNAGQLVPLLARVPLARADLEEMRTRLLQWDGRLTVDSSAATLYVVWERELRRRLAEAAVPSLRDELARASSALVPALTKPSSVWFGGEPGRARDELIAVSFAAAVDSGRAGSAAAPTPWGKIHTALFVHPLGFTNASGARFNIGPFEQAGYVDTVMSTAGPDFAQTAGASFSAIFDVGNWDRSVATNAPGQSGTRGSPHFSDLAKMWAGGEYFPLAFSEAAVQSVGEATLTLVPRR